MKNEIKAYVFWLFMVCLISGLLFFFEDSIGLEDFHFEALDGYVRVPISPAIAMAFLLGNLFYFSVREAYYRYRRKGFTWLLFGFNTTVLFFAAYVYYIIIMLSFIFLFTDVTDISGRDPAQIELAYAEARFVHNTAFSILGILLIHELWLIYQLIIISRNKSTAIEHDQRDTCHSETVRGNIK